MVRDDFGALDQNLPLCWVNQYVVGDHKWCSFEKVGSQICYDESMESGSLQQQRVV